MTIRSEKQKFQSDARLKKRLKVCFVQSPWAVIIRFFLCSRCLSATLAIFTLMGTCAFVKVL